MTEIPGTSKQRISISAYLAAHPVTRELTHATPNPHSLVNDDKIRQLFFRATSQQWFPGDRIDFEAPIDLRPEVRDVWIKLCTVFYTLEKMGQDVIINMMPKATKLMKSTEVSNYLSAQCYDESRHVLILENYLRRLGSPPQFNRIYQTFGTVASQGAFRVQNWLFSTLFSENVASVFLQRMRFSEIDPIGESIGANFLQDEARHISFLKIVLPDLFDKMGFWGRSYVRISQGFITLLTERMSRVLEKDLEIVKLNRKALLEEMFTNTEDCYEELGFPKRFLKFPKLQTAVSVA